MELSSSIGRECRRDIDGIGTIIEFVIYPCADLEITSNVEATLIVPSNYNTRGGGKLFIKSRYKACFNLNRVSIIDATGDYKKYENEIRFPWLDGTTYPLEVYFYTLRYTLRYSDESSIMNFLFDTPIPLRRDFPHPIYSNYKSRSSGIYLRVAAGRNQGRRNYMEDVDFAYPSVKSNNKNSNTSVGIYGVLDGHGGAQCSAFIADEMTSTLATTLRKHQKNTNFAQILYETCLQLDEEYLSSTSNNAGSTANVMLWDKYSGVAYVANVGDTRTVICRDNTAYDITQDRKATTPEEIARVARNGGFVANGRVNGSLAVSRAFGDKALKNSSGNNQSALLTRLEPTTPVVPTPEITMYCPENYDTFMIIASDGLWDVFSSQQAVDWVREKATTSGLLGGMAVDLLINEAACQPEIETIAQQLAQEAVAKGSMDNITVMLVFFDRSEQDPQLVGLGNQVWPDELEIGDEAIDNGLDLTNVIDVNENYSYQSGHRDYNNSHNSSNVLSDITHVDAQLQSQLSGMQVGMDTMDALSDILGTQPNPSFNTKSSNNAPVNGYGLNQNNPNSFNSNTITASMSSHTTATSASASIPIGDIGIGRKKIGGRSVEDDDDMMDFLLDDTNF